MSARLANDLRSALGPARDQGARPTCLAFAASDAHGGLRSPWAALSAEAAFFHAQRRAGRPPSSGAALPYMIEALSEDGQPFETDCPYPSASPDPAIWSLPAWSGPTFQCLGAPVAASWDDLIAALDDNRLVLMLMMLSPGFFAPDADGVIRSVAGGPDPAIRHAVLAVGHGDVEGQPAVLIRNSWGGAWGLEGHAWIARPDVVAGLFGMALFEEKTLVPAPPIAA